MRLVLLSDEFYKTYSDCPEIMRKYNRPYVCLEVRIDELTFAIPLRHHIPHRHCFPTIENSGLDYTKAVVISRSDYLRNERPTIEQKEYNLIKKSEHRIEQGMRKYLKLYRSAWQYRDNPEYQKILHWSTLQYFHKELGL